MALVDCQIKGCELRLHHIYQGEYVAMHEIHLDGEELNVFNNCIDRISMGGKPEKLKKV